MNYKIKKINEDQFSINGKILYIDGEGNWVASVELTTKEIEASNNHIKIIQNV